MKMYVKTVLSVEGTMATHIAELKEIDSTSCAMLRILEVEGGVVTRIPKPTAVVPHPDTFDKYEDITATHLSAEEFEQMWQQAAS